MSDDTPRTLRLRRRLDESQATFARRLGVSQPTIFRLEAGQPETGAQRLLLDQIERELLDHHRSSRPPVSPDAAPGGSLAGADAVASAPASFSEGVA